MGSQNSKCQDLPIFQFEGVRGDSWVIKTQRSAYFSMGGGGYCWVVKTQSARICLIFNFREEGGDHSGLVKTQSARICRIFNFQGRRGVLLGSQNSKYQDLPNFQLSGEGVFLGSQIVNSPKAVVHISFILISLCRIS